ncbi:MAG: alkaline phosphatase [Bryobacterales bacterium]|nr:alkaline phosphatase [Bryobacterales bacterium]
MILLAILLLAAPLHAAGPHVIVVGLDGCSPDGIRKADHPTFQQLMKEGAWTMKARGVMPTVSSPNWASMIMGAGPEQHGITSNDWQPAKFEFPANFLGPKGIFPTMFGLLREQQPSARIAIFHDWEGFGRLVEPGVASIIGHPKGPRQTMAEAIAEWKEHQPTLLFIHLDHIDHAGHEEGHGTPAYYESVREAGRLIAQLREAIGAAKVHLIVTSDHGGKGKKHGGNTLEELEIPWLIAGPGVRPGHEIQATVNTYDTAATVAYILQLKTPQAWIGRPVREAFGK